MKTLNPLDPATRREPRKRDEDIIRERQHVALAIDERRLALLVLEVHHGHEQRGLHVHGAVQPEDRREPLLHDPVERGVLRQVRFEVVHEPPGGPGGLAEQRGEHGLVVRRVGFRWGGGGRCFCQRTW